MSVLIADHHSACVGTWYPAAQGPRKRARFATVWPVNVPDPRAVEAPPQRLPSWVAIQSCGAVQFVTNDPTTVDEVAPAAARVAVVPRLVTSSFLPHWKNAPRYAFCAALGAAEDG